MKAFPFMTRRRVLCLGFVLCTVLLLCSPMMLNEYRLWVFSRQLNDLDSIFAGHYEILAKGAQVYNNTNGEACSYRAVVLIRYFATPIIKSDVRSKLAQMNFRPAQANDNNRPVKADLTIDRQTFFVMLKDGPYGATLDPRCW